MAHAQTVRGPIDPAELGVTLPHEHTQISLWHIASRWDYWQLTRDEPVILDELAAFRQAGGATLVDLTLPGVGRDPVWLRTLSEKSGLNLVMGCGWYRTAYYPPEALIDRRTTDDLAAELLGEIAEGVGDTRIRPGIIGEIGTDKPWLTAQEERVHRAAARAARTTGLAITTHAVLSDVGRAQLRVFEEEGVDPGRVVIGHADSYPHLDHYLSIVETGASVEFDFLGMSFSAVERLGEGPVIDLLLELLSRGHAERVLLSQDVCHDSQLRHYEGHGYTYLADTFLPRLRARGVSDAEIRQLTVDNPRRILTIA
jgi:predicted metal-dependent phosphotriesterase family hydrolase